MGHKSLALIVLGLVALGLVVGGSGFTAATMTRPTSIGVAEDTSAYLSYDAACDGSELAVELTNRFGETPLQGTVSVNGTEEPFELDPANNETLRFTPVTEGDSATVRAAKPDGGIAIEFTRTVESTCVRSTVAANSTST